MDNNPTFKKDLIEAWERYMNDTYTRDDFALVIDSIRDDEHIQDIKEVFIREWNKLPPTSEDRKEIYRKEFAQFFDEYENMQKKKKMQTIRILSQNNTGRLRRIWYAAAAAILLGLLIPATYLLLKPIAEPTVLYVEEHTGRGEIKTVFLPDQTEVTLNAGSRIKYPANFTEDERSVELAGEALFNVTSDPTRPFIVKTENMNVRVVGTVFDVKEYANDLSLSVSVASGKVEVDLDGEKLILEQNQQMKMDKSTGMFEKLTIDAGKYFSWTDGILYFYRTPICEVVNMLNRHYPQTEVELAEGEYSFLITGEHNSKRLEVVLTSIVYSTDLKCKKTKDKYILYSEE